jgi:hypothetical protein
MKFQCLKCKVPFYTQAFDTVRVGNGRLFHRWTHEDCNVLSHMPARTRERPVKKSDE